MIIALNPMEQIFANLLSNSEKIPAGELQRLAALRFSSVVADSGFTLANPSDSLTDDLVIGIASYSLPELKMLDQIRALRVGSEMRKTPSRISVFDVLSCENAEDFERLIPGIGKALQTPVIGMWQQGNVVKLATGWEATEFLRDLFDIPEK